MTASANQIRPLAIRANGLRCVSATTQLIVGRQHSRPPAGMATRIGLDKKLPLAPRGREDVKTTLNAIRRPKDDHIGFKCNVEPFAPHWHLLDVTFDCGLLFVARDRVHNRPENPCGWEVSESHTFRLRRRQDRQQSARLQAQSQPLRRAEGAPFRSCSIPHESHAPALAELQRVQLLGEG